MYSNVKELDDKIIKFLSVPENYLAVKEIAILLDAEAFKLNKKFCTDLDMTMGMLCSLHLFHGFTLEKSRDELIYMLYNFDESRGTNEKLP